MIKKCKENVLWRSFNTTASCHTIKLLLYNIRPNFLIRIWLKKKSKEKVLCNSFDTIASCHTIKLLLYNIKPNFLIRKL